MFKAFRQDNAVTIPALYSCNVFCFVFFPTIVSPISSEVLHPNQEKTDAVVLLRGMYVLVCGFV